MKSFPRLGLLCFIVSLLMAPWLEANPASAIPAGRERLLLDFGWRFALGHAADHQKDFAHGTGQFSHFAKTGFAAGASAPDFDDSSWRKVDLPHDWAVELPFDSRGSGSHGFKAIGLKFPENSVGWYRKSFSVPTTDLGRRISIDFDGVYRDAQVWVNGHYVGRETSGYSHFSFNLSEFLNYGAENVIVVRVDASLEEGWFYEGAGIYRHVWLTKTHPLHFERDRTFVHAEIKPDQAQITIEAALANEAFATEDVSLVHLVLDPHGKEVARVEEAGLNVEPGRLLESRHQLVVAGPQLWSLTTPQLYTLESRLISRGQEIDRTLTPFGLRSIHFDPQQGFFLNGERIQIQGTNNHQDHAGVGVAVPDALLEFRLQALKAMGVNAYRVSHHPASPELLALCDRLGILVINENRLMGTSEYHYDHLERMIRRDRNHPSIILWSIGNEEWKIEGNELGHRITSAMQARVKQLDPTRPVTVAISGGWGKGSSMAIDVAGFNYIGNGDTDAQHARRPEQPIVGTEEFALNNTRGVYFDDPARAHSRAYDFDPSTWGSSAVQGWSHYAQRPWLAGLFIWTGFDYRGEPTPYGWPAIHSQFGVMDTCGFPKDAYHYFKAQWSREPVLHLFPHWNWAGREGSPIEVWVYSNCESVELFLNGRSLGTRSVPAYSYASWTVPYEPGELRAQGRKAGVPVLETKVRTTGPAARIALEPHRSTLRGDGEDVSVISIRITDQDGATIPDAARLVHFSVEGPGRLIGVGNGDPSSHEADVYFGEADPNWRRSTFNGLAQVLLRTTQEAGALRLTATTPGLPPTVLELDVAAASARPSIP